MIKHTFIIPHQNVDINEMIADLPPGEYELLIKKKSRTATRYAFYFPHVLGAILEKCSEFFILNGEPITNVDDLHLIMKLKYNPVTMVDSSTGEMVKMPGATKTMDNKRFIDEFMEQIISDFSQPPFNVDFADCDRWIESRRQYLN